MDVGARQMQDVCLRLSSLEASARKMNEELLSVQRENIFLQREVLNMQRENKELKEKIGTIQGNVANLNQANNANRPGKEKSKKLQGDVAVLKQIPNQVKQLNEKIQTIGSLQADVTVLKQANAQNRQQMNDNLKSLHTDVAGLKQLPKQIKQLNERFKAIDQKTDARMKQMGDLQRVMTRALVEGQGGRVYVKQEIKTLSKTLTTKIAPLEKRKNQIDRSRVNVVFDTANIQLVDNKYVKLDQCLHVIQNGGCWNAASYQARVNVTGQYLVNIFCVQKGNGKIGVLLKSDKGIHMSMGITDHDGHVVISTYVLYTYAQDNMWLEVCRVSGDETLKHCWLYCQLL